MCLNYEYYSTVVYYKVTFKDVCWLLCHTSCIISKYNNRWMLQVAHVLIHLHVLVFET